MPSSLEQPPIQDNYVHFEQHVAKIFHQHGWTVETPKQNQPGYDLVVSKSNIVAAVQVKWLKNNVAAPQILKFVDFLDSKAGQQFNYGILLLTPK